MSEIKIGGLTIAEWRDKESRGLCLNDHVSFVQALDELEGLVALHLAMQASRDSWQEAYLGEHKMVDSLKADNEIGIARRESLEAEIAMYRKSNTHAELIADNARLLGERDDYLRLLQQSADKLKTAVSALEDIPQVWCEGGDDYAAMVDKMVLLANRALAALSAIQKRREGEDGPK